MGGRFGVNRNWPREMLKIAGQRGLQSGYAGIGGGYGKGPAFGYLHTLV
jgi:hypothetical protein